MASRYKHERRLRVFNGEGELLHDSGWKAQRGGRTTAIYRMSLRDQYKRHRPTAQRSSHAFTCTRFYNGAGWRTIAVQIK